MRPPARRAYAPEGSGNVLNAELGMRNAECRRIHIEMRNVLNAAYAPEGSGNAECGKKVLGFGAIVDSL